MTGWYDERYRQAAEKVADRLVHLETVTSEAMVMDVFQGPDVHGPAAIVVSV